MATRQAIRQATVAALKADAAVAALVADRVYEDRHAPYPAGSPCPVLFVSTPTTTSAHDSDDEQLWASTETLAIAGIVARTATEDDGDLAEKADILELAILTALLPLMSWRETCGIEEIRGIQRERVHGADADAHREQTTVSIQFLRHETFAAADSATLLDLIRVNFDRANDTTGAPGGVPYEFVADIDTSP